MKLLNPGPVSVTERVRKALLREDLCHREVECEDLVKDVRQKLVDVYDAADKYEAILLTGSGTAAVEAMLSSCVGVDDRVLLLANGVYGYRMGDILTRYAKNHQQLDFGLTGAIDFAEVEKALQQGQFTQIAFVHHETTVGRLNDLPRLLALCEQYDLQLLVDGVSSFGGEPIDFTHDHLLAVAATANKCLHGFPGISFVVVKRDAIAAMMGNSASLYLDLANHYQSQVKGKVAFTPAVQILYALQEALDEIADQGGWQARYAHYLELSKQLREGFKQQGIDMLLPESECVSMLTSFKLPEGSDFEALHAHFKENGFVIYPGQLGLGKEIFRVAVMGELMVFNVKNLVGRLIEIKATDFL